MIIGHGSATLFSIFFNRFTAIGGGLTRQVMWISDGKMVEKIKQKGDISIALNSSSSQITRISNYCTAANAAATR